MESPGHQHQHKYAKQCRQWCATPCLQHHEDQPANRATYPGKINFMQIAAGFGLETCDLNNEADPQAALQEIINRPGPALIHVRIDAEEKVYPMVPPGAANTEMVGE